MAVTFGGGGLVAVNAASSAPSSVITVEPTRILDTRTVVGLSGPFVSGVSQTLQVTGTVPTQPAGGAVSINAEVVPAAATAVVLNATVIRPTTNGFLSIRPGDVNGAPATSNINWAAGGPNVANSVIVQLPADGTIDVFVSGTVGEVLIDVAGYTISTPAGSVGPPGPPGPSGVTPGRVVWVAQSGGDFTSIQAAIDSITDAAFDNTYVVKVAPGQYFEQITMEPFIDVRGAGADVTSIIGSGTAQGLAIVATVTGAAGTTVSDISVSDETTVGNNVQAVSMFAEGVGSFTMRNVDIDAIGDTASLTTGGLRASGTVTVDMFDVSINAKGAGANPVEANGSSSIIGSEVTILNNGTGSGSALSSNDDGTISVNDATIRGDAVAFGAGSIRIVDSEMDGFGFAGTSCHNTTDAEFRDLAEDCQRRDRDLMWAKVDAGTSTIAVTASDGVDLNPVLPNPAARLGVGIYTVTFDRSIVGCAWTATSSDNDAGAVTPRILAVERNAADDDFTLRVRSFDFDGVPTDTAEDDGFSLVVNCVDRIQRVG